MKITADLFRACLECPTKCWLRAAGEASTENAYAEWVKAQDESFHAKEIGRLVGDLSNDELAKSPEAEHLKSAKWQLATNISLLTQMNSSAVESSLHAIERMPSEGRGRLAQFVPIRFVFRNKLTKDDKLLLAFDAFLLSEFLGREVGLGKIIHGDDHATFKVKTSALASKVRKLIEKTAALLASPTPPHLVLNRHCAECEFRDRCSSRKPRAIGSSLT
jgi:predicted RecB family nuclease